MLMQIMVVSLMLMGPSLTFCIKLGDALFKWRSKCQPMSTIEDEYKVLSNVACDYVYLQCFLHELKTGGGSSCQIFNDNHSCMKFVDNPILHARTKHIKT